MMNKEKLSELISLLEKMQKTENQQNREDIKNLAGKLVLICNSIEAKDLQSQEKMALCVDQYSFASQILFTLTAKEMEELFPINAEVGSSEYISSKSFLRMVDNHLINEVDWLCLYHNTKIQVFLSMRDKLLETIGKHGLVELIKEVNKYKLYDIPGLSQKAMLEWYSNMHTVNQFLLKLNVDEIVKLFPCNDNDYVSKYTIRMLKGNPLVSSDNLNDFITHYNNPDLQEFLIRLWFAQDIAEKYQAKQTQYTQVGNQ